MPNAKPMITGEEYKTLVEQSPILIWRSNTAKKCDYFNERWLEFTGRAMEQELGDGWTEGVFPEDLKNCFNIFSGSFDKRIPFEMEYRLKRRDGVYRWIFDRGAPFYGENGGFGGYIGSCVDIHERVEARELLRREKDEAVNALRELLPICAHCKKIRDDKGQWHQVEEYFKERKKTVFTHSICPECSNKVLKGEK